MLGNVGHKGDFQPDKLSKLTPPPATNGAGTPTAASAGSSPPHSDDVVQPGSAQTKKEFKLENEISFGSQIKGKLMSVASKLMPANALNPLNELSQTQLMQDGFSDTKKLGLAVLMAKTGHRMLQQGDYAGAATAFTTALDLHQQSVVPMGNDSGAASLNAKLGEVHWKMGDKDKAVEYFQQALNLDPGNSQLRHKIDQFLA